MMSRDPNDNVIRQCTMYLLIWLSDFDSVENWSSLYRQVMPGYVAFVTQ